MTQNVIIFNIDAQRFAVFVNEVERIVWIPEITPAPQSPDSIMGFFNLHGEVIPVVNLRRLLSLEIRDPSVADQLIICNFSQKKIALWIDQIEEVYSCPDEELLSSSNPNIAYTIRKKEEIIIVYDWNRLISFAAIEYLGEISS